MWQQDDDRTGVIGAGQDLHYSGCDADFEWRLYEVIRRVGEAAGAEAELFLAVTADLAARVARWLVTRYGDSLDPAILDSGSGLTEAAGVIQLTVVRGAVRGPGGLASRQVSRRGWAPLGLLVGNSQASSVVARSTQARVSRFADWAARASRGDAC